MIRTVWRRFACWLGVRPPDVQEILARSRTSPTETKRSAAALFAITVDETGFEVAALGSAAGTPPLRIEWRNIQQVAVFKRDLVFVDMLCLLVELPGPSTVELNEEMEGWPSFVEALPQFLAGTRPWHEWFMQVAFPAFDANPTLIYSRKGAAGAPQS